MTIDEQMIIATEDHECNACLWVLNHIENNPTDTGIRFSEWRQIIDARWAGYMVRKGELCRSYKWSEYYIDEEDGTTHYEEPEVLYEIPAMADICKRLKLYP